MESYRVVAAIEPWDDMAAVSATVARLLAQNGGLFGLTLFGSLPSEIINEVPAFVPAGLILRACFDLLEWWEEEQGGACLALAEEHYGRMVEPEHLQRSLDIAVRFAESGDFIAASFDVPVRARERLLEEWFATAYPESRGDEG